MSDPERLFSDKHACEECKQNGSSSTEQCSCQSSRNSEGGSESVDLAVREPSRAELVVHEPEYEGSSTTGSHLWSNSFECQSGVTSPLPHGASEVVRSHVGKLGGEGRASPAESHASSAVHRAEEQSFSDELDSVDPSFFDLVELLEQASGEPGVCGVGLAHSKPTALVNGVW